MIPSIALVLTYVAPFDLDTIDRTIDGIFQANGASAHAVIGNGNWYTTDCNGVRGTVETGARVVFARDDGIPSLRLGGLQVYPKPGAVLQVRIYTKEN